MVGAETPGHGGTRTAGDLGALETSGRGSRRAAGELRARAQATSGRGSPRSAQHSLRSRRASEALGAELVAGSAPSRSGPAPGPTPGPVPPTALATGRREGTEAWTVTPESSALPRRGRKSGPAGCRMGLQVHRALSLGAVGTPTSRRQGRSGGGGRPSAVLEGLPSWRGRGRLSAAPESRRTSAPPSAPAPPALVPRPSGLRAGGARRAESQAPALPPALGTQPGPPALGEVRAPGPFRDE